MLPLRFVGQLSAQGVLRICAVVCFFAGVSMKRYSRRPLVARDVSRQSLVELRRAANRVLPPSRGTNEGEDRPPRPIPDSGWRADHKHSTLRYANSA